MPHETAANLIDIVIVNWNAGPDLARCLDAIEAGGDLALIGRIIVVDNGSTDDSLAQIVASKLPLVIDRVGRNLGFAAGVNRGAAHASAEFLMLLNPDARPLPGAFRILHAAIGCTGSGPPIGIVGPRLVDHDGTTVRGCTRFPRPFSFWVRALGLDRTVLGRRHASFMLDWAHDESRVVDQVMGACLVIRRSLFVMLGGLDERFFVYFEDLDLALRARREGWVSWYEASATVIHEGGGASRSIPARRLAYILASRLAYAGKHFGRGGYLSVAAATFLIEPWTRLVLSFIRAEPGGPAAVLGAYAILVRRRFGRTG